jgi:hypothetical protein
MTEGNKDPDPDSHWPSGIVPELSGIRISNPTTRSAAADGGELRRRFHPISPTQDPEVTMRRDLRILCATALLSSLLRPAFAAEPSAAPIAEKMAVATDDLNRAETGKPVQTVQKAIVHDLDELIASLEKQCQNCRTGMKRNNPNRGMADSTISSGTGGIGTLLNPGDNGKDWGKLSGRERDRILQSMSEGFPPEYRTVLERYYRRLADEKTGSASAASGGARPKTPEAPKGAGEKP